MANDLGLVLIYDVNVACPHFWIGTKMYETMMSALSCIPTLKKNTNYFVIVCGTPWTPW